MINRIKSQYSIIDKWYIVSINYIIMMRAKKYLTKFTVISVLLSSLFLNAAYSQDIESATRQIDKQSREDLESKLQLSPEEITKRMNELDQQLDKLHEPAQTPAKGGTAFFIEKITLIGVKSISKKKFSHLIKQYENKEVTLNQIKILAKDIERIYLENGIIAACFVPPQKIKDKTISIKVIEAKMGQLKVSKHPYFDNNKLYKYWKIPQGEVIHYDKISYSLQFMNKNPDRKVKAVLHAGEKPQTTDILLNVKTKQPLHFTASFDREGSPYTGVRKYIAGVRHNNLLNLDDTFIGGYAFGKDFNGTYFYHTIPISHFGTSLMYGYSYNKSFPKKDYTAFLIDSRAKTTSIFLRQDLFRKRKYIGEVYLGIDAKDKISKMAGTPVTKDRLRILTLGNSLLFRGQQNLTQLKTEISQGINGLGAIDLNPLSSRGAKNTFTKLNLTANHKRILPFKPPFNLQLNFECAVQFASTILPSSETFSLGGINSVRGYPAGDYLADEAVQTRTELIVPFVPSFFIPEFVKAGKVSLKKKTSFLLFWDYARGKRRHPSSTEKRTANLMGVGAGLRIQLMPKTILRLEWGFPVKDNTITEEADSFFHFSVDFETN